MKNGQQSQQNPSTPGSSTVQQHDNIGNGNSLNHMSSGGGPKINMRNDLHFAADSVSIAMSSLVRELNSGEGLFNF
jgi:hypothetical protein